MWQLLTALQPNSVTLPPGTYHAPAYYDERSLEELTVLLSKLVKGVQFSHLLTWEQARWLRGTSPLGQSSLLVLHGDSGVSFGETDSLEDTLFERAEQIPATWRLVQVPRSRLTKLSWITRYVQGPLLAMLREQFQSEHHPLRDCSIADFPLSLAAKITHDPIDLSRLIEHTIQHRLSFGQEGRRFRPQDWERSLHWSAGALLAGRIPNHPRVSHSRMIEYILHDLGREEHFPIDQRVPLELQQAGLLDVWKENQEPSSLTRHAMNQQISRTAFSSLSRADKSLIEPRMIWAENYLLKKPRIREEWIESAQREGYEEYASDLKRALDAKTYLEVLRRQDDDDIMFLHDFPCDPQDVEEQHHVFIMKCLSQATYVPEHTIEVDNTLEYFLSIVNPQVARPPSTTPQNNKQTTAAQIAKMAAEEIFNHDTFFKYADYLKVVHFNLAISFVAKYQHSFEQKFKSKELIRLAEIYRSHGQFHSHAARWFERAIQQSPKSVEARLAFARFLKDDLSDLDRAEDLYARAWRLTPEDPELCREFAAFLREQRDDEAWAAEVEQQASPAQE